MSAATKSRTLKSKTLLAAILILFLAFTKTLAEGRGSVTRALSSLLDDLSITVGGEYTIPTLDTVSTAGDTTSVQVTLNGGLIASTAEVTSLVFDGHNLHVTAMGEVSYFSTTGTTLTVSAQSDGDTNLVQVDPASSLTMDADFDSPSNGVLRYIGPGTRKFHCGLSISYKHAGAGGADAYVITICKNTTPIGASRVIGTTSSTSWESTALHVMTQLGTNDSLCVKVGNLNDSDDVTIGTFNLFAMSSPEGE